MAKHAVPFFIRVETGLRLLEDICLENGETNEKLLVVKRDAFVMISRYQMAANDAWIEANVQEILTFEHVSHDRTIYLGRLD
jgi:hypothetical protein